MYWCCYWYHHLSLWCHIMLTIALWRMIHNISLSPPMWGSDMKSFVSVAVTADSGAARGNQYPQWAEVWGLTRQAFQTECRFTNYFLICMSIHSESTITKLSFSKTMQEANSWELFALHSTNVANFTQIGKIHHPHIQCHHHNEHLLWYHLLYHSPSFNWIWNEHSTHIADS